MPSNQLELPPLFFPTIADAQTVFKELADSFQRTETKVLHIQDELGETPIPSINQLRYAGYHLSQLISKSDLSAVPVSVDHSHLISAYRHCLRAYYDAFDFSVTLVSKTFSDIEQQYHDLLISIETYFPKYPDWRVQIAKVLKLKDSLEEQGFYENVRDKSKREQYYAILEERIKEILEIYQYLPLVADKLAQLQEQSEKEKSALLNQIAEQNREREIAESRYREGIKRQNVSLWVAIGSLITAVAAILIAAAVVVFDDDLKTLGRELRKSHQAPQLESQKK